MPRAHLRIISMLFAPGSDERKLRRAFTGVASLAVADLEDSVPDTGKGAARTRVAAVLDEIPARSGAPLRAVRVNALDTAHADADLDLVASLDLDAIVIPKASAERLERLAETALPPVIAIIETPRGLQESARIAQAPGVSALLLGAVDLARSLKLGVRADGLDLLYARSRLVIDSAAAGLQPPIDGVYTAIEDLEGLRAEVEMVRSVGFGGKACIHPSHVAIVEAGFRPSSEELAWAQRVVDAYAAAAAEGTGAIRLDGEMVDVPVVERARELLAQATGQ